MKKYLFVFILGSVVCRIPSVWSAEVVDRLIAVVGSEIITLSDLKNHSGKDTLEALIREKLLKQEMERLRILATNEEISGSIQEVLARNKVSLEGLKGELSKKGISFEKYKRDLAEQIRGMKFTSQVIFPRIKISDDEIARKAGANPSEETRLRARIELLQARSTEELNKYLEEVRAKTYVEIKK